MALFSKRLGFVKFDETIQKESMSQDLQIGLWNAIDIFILSPRKSTYFISDYSDIESYFVRLYLNYFVLPIDTMPSLTEYAYKTLRDKFFKFSWVQVYDFLEFTFDNYPYQNKEDFSSYCNSILEREFSAYRFVGGELTPITSQEEIDEVDLAISSSTNSVKEHLKSALKFMSNKKSPNYRNSVKESISAIESICQKITGDDGAELPKALKMIEKNGLVELHPALKLGFDKIYGYTSDGDGIRHALLDEDTVSFEDAKFFLVSCSAFINYLTTKADKAKIEIK